MSTYKKLLCPLVVHLRADGRMGLMHWIRRMHWMCRMRCMGWMCRTRRNGLRFRLHACHLSPIKSEQLIEDSLELFWFEFFLLSISTRSYNFLTQIPFGEISNSFLKDFESIFKGGINWFQFKVFVGLRIALILEWVEGNLKNGGVSVLLVKSNW